MGLHFTSSLQQFQLISLEIAGGDRNAEDDVDVDSFQLGSLCYCMTETQ